MKFENYMTIREICETYYLKRSTINAYILRGEVIPEDKKIKIGRQWFIDREFAKKKWGTLQSEKRG